MKAAVSIACSIAGTWLLYTLAGTKKKALTIFTACQFDPGEGQVVAEPRQVWNPDQEWIMALR